MSRPLLVKPTLISRGIFSATILSGSAVIGVSHFIKHTFLLNFLKNRIELQGEDGPIKPTEKLTSIFNDVSNDVKEFVSNHTFMVPFLVPGIRVIHGGTYGTIQGGIVGLPAFFDFNTKEDVEKNGLANGNRDGWLKQDGGNTREGGQEWALSLLLGCFSFVDISAGFGSTFGGTRILGGGVGKTRKYNKATHQLNGRRDSAITLSTRPLDFDLCLRMGRDPALLVLLRGLPVRETWHFSEVYKVSRLDYIIRQTAMYCLLYLLKPLLLITQPTQGFGLLGEDVSNASGDVKSVCGLSAHQKQVFLPLPIFLPEVGAALDADNKALKQKLHDISGEKPFYQHELEDNIRTLESVFKENNIQTKNKVNFWSGKLKSEHCLKDDLV
ncbi:hypothetical protein J6590_002542 [Homalodisca vitripennis]|nr:hypothetical protein J6590_002542 [Homalodisca vitripennis]